MRRKGTDLTTPGLVQDLAQDQAATKEDARVFHQGRTRHMRRSTTGLPATEM